MKKKEVLLKVFMMTKYVSLGIVIQAFLCGMLIAGESSAQKSIDEIYLDCKVKDAKITKVFNNIEKVTSFRFSYKKDVVDQVGVFTFSFENASLGDVLRSISKESGLSFKRVNNSILVKDHHIISVEEEEEEMEVIALQDMVVNGTVTSEEDGEPLPGVSIMVKGTASGTTTDIDGKFSISLPSDGVLVMSYIGFVTQEIPVNGQSIINVSLEIDMAQLQEVVVVGYGTQRKADITGAVGVVNVEETRKYSTGDMSQLLQGRTAGVMVTNDGQPGAAPNVMIRGVGTFGNHQPLYVIDGVPIGTSPRDFNPNDIESIQVLKDASAAAIYGSRAMNGVIIITTKSGKKNAPLKVEYNGYYGVDQLWQRMPVLGREQYQEIVNEVRSNAGQTLIPGNDPNSSFYIDNVDTDWQEAGIKNGSRQNHNINLTGGSEYTTYNISLDYFANQGTFEGNGPDYTRYSGRVNTTTEKGRFRFGQNFYYTHSFENTLTYNSTVLKGNRPPLIIDLVEAIPTQMIYDENNEGGYGGTEAEIHNTISLNAIGINNMFDSYAEVDRTLMSGWGEYALVESEKHNLKYKLNLSYDKTIAHDYSFIPAFDLGYFFNLASAQLDEGNRTYTSSLVENTLNYQFVSGNHTVDALVGQMYQSVSFYDAFGHTEDLTKPYFPTLGSGANKAASGSKSEAVLSSYLMRVNYNYNDKYLLTATARRDGSSKFAPSNRYGFFPSVAVGWRISNESFLSMPSFISDLKLRASYGVLGGQEISDYLYTAYINNNIPYNFNGTKVIGGTQTSVVSENIKWEEKTTSNIGADVQLFEGAVEFSAEYYNSKTEDLLVGVPIPFTVGSVNFRPTVNAGSMRNQGFEFMATYRKIKGDFNFSASANFSTLKNEVLALGGNNEPIYGVGAKTEVGGEIGRHFGYETEGIFQTSDEVDAHAFQNILTSPGDIKFKDQLTVDTDGDGILDAGDGVINDEDRVYLGSGLPKYNFGFNITAGYKNFDFSLFASGAAGYLINSRLYRDLMLTTDYINRHEDILNRWTPENTDTDIPRLVNGDPNGNGRDSDRAGWLQKGDYLRLNTISLGYTIPDGTIRGIDRARVYVTVQNLYTFQAYKGYNPDFNADVFSPGFNAGSFPRPRTMLAGVQLGF
ncbi:TonB-dependent receptor [Flammeovirgaceae bacterium SG7u.111]|nr:TonB-dependent receptor [Flammeovirgaceae bacterium SG7u.132]WPO34901.1 TonB-dependent receptor [Flammeovirgaceae bacterium SG7u.111]